MMALSQAASIFSCSASCAHAFILPASSFASVPFPPTRRPRMRPRIIAPPPAAAPASGQPGSCGAGRPARTAVRGQRAAASPSAPGRRTARGHAGPRGREAAAVAAAAAAAGPAALPGAGRARPRRRRCRLLYGMRRHPLGHAAALQEWGREGGGYGHAAAPGRAGRRRPVRGRQASGTGRRGRGRREGCANWGPASRLAAGRRAHNRLAHCTNGRRFADASPGRLAAVGCFL